MAFNISIDIEFTSEVYFMKEKWYWRLEGRDETNSNIIIEINHKIPFESGKDARKSMEEFIIVNCLNLGN
jgi:hypothetical protein